MWELWKHNWIAKERTKKKKLNRIHDDEKCLAHSVLNKTVKLFNDNGIPKPLIMYFHLYCFIVLFVFPFQSCFFCCFLFSHILPSINHSPISYWLYVKQCIHKTTFNFLHPGGKWNKPYFEINGHTHKQKINEDFHKNHFCFRKINWIYI